MLRIPTPLFRDRRGGRRRIEPQGPPGPPVAPFRVEAVTTDDAPEPGRCYWRFGAAVTVTGPVGGLRAFVGGAWRDPVSAAQVDARAVLTLYDTPETLDGKGYGIVATPTGIAQAAGIVLPQGGTIGAP